MFIAEVCEKYGWTYSEYMSNPQWFLDLVREKYKIDAKRSEMAQKRKI